MSDIKKSFLTDNELKRNITGPPGTGKTYLAKKFVEVLLRNRESWFGKENPRRQGLTQGCPILVVCYTNHALDQFLEGIIEFMPDRICRIGSRSKSEILENYNLSYYRNDFQKNRKFTAPTARLINSSYRHDQD